MKYEADKDPTGEILTANWSSMSKPEKEAALRDWNADYNKRHPYVPTGEVTTWRKLAWEGLLWFCGVLAFVLLRQQIEALISYHFLIFLSLGTSGVVVYLLHRLDQSDSKMSSLEKRIAAIEDSNLTGSVDSNK
jgi:hypothetical protein